ncbi:hypothetical protein [Flexibacterium corallicola]|uniref:hypothetical protein n=1 Tax=Flexibacterium corallicola TaxID=3037259 RepID=UPI00286F6BD3|nr:hypothetical protein [Pseudovibrio sp. M1P-2-3]
MFVFGSGDGDDIITDFTVDLDYIEFVSGASFFDELSVTSESDDTAVASDGGPIVLISLDSG